MKKFDTKIQLLKYQVLLETAKRAWAGLPPESFLEIPKAIVPGKKPTMRCCVYKERAILAERVRLALGGDKSNPNIVEVIDIACDDCPLGGYEVTNACRGCLAHRCYEACPKGAISFDDNQKAVIDKNKCVGCGLCAKACPYTAIICLKRPCENACKANAVSSGEDGVAHIGPNCTNCGACVYQCPFGAMSEKSFILNLIDILKKSESNKKYRVYAVVAPAIAGQFADAKLGQVVAGIKKLGFYDVAEAALGADMTADAEAKELAEKGFMTSSCCPAFVKYVEEQFPNLKGKISHNLSPMAAISRHIKSTDPTAKTVFIGPCTAKKAEIRKESVRPYVDNVITFEELQALFDSRNIDLPSLPDEKPSGASRFGRGFARSAGVSAAVAQAIKENGLNVKFEPVVCNGLTECRAALLRADKNLLPGNFIEGMACERGCVGGAGCLTHGDGNRRDTEEYCNEAADKTIRAAIAAVASTALGKSKKKRA